MWRVVDTRAFQRLRRVKQLGFSDFVYPGASHTRFAHSLGVFHTARQLMRIIESHLGAAQFMPSRANVALAAALVHDLGHGPFSHAFEDVGARLGLKMAHHENVSDALIKHGDVSDALNSLGSGFANDVAAVVKGAGPGNLYSAVVSSQFDADRLDYMRRDRLMTGTQLAGLDFEWLIANIEVGSVPAGVDESPLGNLDTFVLGPKAVYAAEAYVLGLFQLYPTVYFHKATRAAEKTFTELLHRVILLAKDGSVDQTGLPANHALVQFANDPDNIERVLPLDDTTVWGALGLLSEASDKAISEFSCRLRDRKLFKCVDVRSKVEHRLGADGSSAKLASIDKACAAIGEKIKEWTTANTTNVPRILIDEAARQPYKLLQESKGPLNQIRIRTPGGELVDLGERSKVVRAIEPFRLFRVYCSDSDQSAREFVEHVINGETANG